MSSYAFDFDSRSMVELVERGTHAPTPLFSVFAELLTAQTGLRARYATDGGETLWLYLEDEDIAALAGKAPPVSEILAWLSKAATAVGRPLLDYRYIRLYGYGAEGRDTFFYIHMPAMDAQVKRVLSQSGFALRRFHELADGHYHIIYPTQAQEYTADTAALTDAISAEVDRYIRDHDEFGFFAAHPARPVITSIESLTYAGLVEAVIRDNPCMRHKPDQIFT